MFARKLWLPDTVGRHIAFVKVTVACFLYPAAAAASVSTIGPTVFELSSSYFSMLYMCLMRRFEKVMKKIGSIMCPWRAFLCWNWVFWGYWDLCSIKYCIFVFILKHANFLWCKTVFRLQVHTEMSQVEYLMLMIFSHDALPTISPILRQVPTMGSVQKNRTFCISKVHPLEYNFVLIRYWLPPPLHDPRGG